MAEGIVVRGLRRVRTLLAEGRGQRNFDPRLAVRVRGLLRECASGAGGEVSARLRAGRLAETYLRLNDEGRAGFLRLIATEFGPDPEVVAKAHADYQDAIGSDGQWAAESALRRALRSDRLRILTQFNTLPQGVKFLVDLRADLLRHVERDAALLSLDRELESRLGAWFDVGFLELRTINWSSPAALLEKLIKYEAVHEIRSWSDLKNRLDSDRRCYAFFHPRMPMEPLIFVEVALIDHLADNVQSLLDEHAPVFDAQRASTAIFYSISNTQVGLRGVSFGNFLLKRVVDDLKRDHPRLVNFATLSPLPTFRRWAEKNPAAWQQAFGDADLERIRRHLPAEAPLLTDAGELPKLLADGNWSTDARLARALQHGLTRLAARYLLTTGKGGRPYDPVARFHLGNGARIERLNYLADTSARGQQQSYALMVNYLYDPDTIEANVEAFSRSGEIAAAAAIRRSVRD
ncbi:MAG TPA: malonyl-CoA decarboxylase [Accumulibacter sp.]|uniref:malonyl-CoA decarboxylase n=1 Tax=Accumulibacter sp. TaxID=2053492 RepID=UPI0025F9B6A8|nr:malonyl-CoA decarboxylase [Accumulibacter sp.]MCM8600188.1 malonyl-CoA decarboxylase [Accumulibacter sp.]MCM8664011.1 malonyl-CoA decarboxylase [Accumulibacter sp.]HNC51937.1 malonyl-CoA decarboxylase [Accumulibacter sp.]